MDNNIILTIIEFVASTIVEGIILASIFQWIANKTQAKQQEMLAQEMNNIEKQNKFVYQQMMQQTHDAKIEIISQIKESSKKG
jgi:adenine-specific DNA methylase